MTAIERALHEEATNYRGPIQIFDLQQIRANMVAMGRAVGGIGRVLLPVKSFPAPEVIKLASELGAGFEISARPEFDLLPDDLRGVTVALNAPHPGDLERYVERGNRLHVHLDSPEQAAGLATPPGAELALRLSHTALGLENVTAGRAALSRFGSSADVWVESAPLFHSGQLTGVHVHNGSEVNTAAFYRAVLAVILSVAHEHDMRLSSINLGGGFHPIDQPTLMPLLETLTEEAAAVPLYIEPGRVLSRGAGYLLAQVVSIRRMDEDRYNVIVDASHDCHAQWARLEWSAAHELDAERFDSFSLPSLRPGTVGVHFTGSTCAERDVLSVYRLPGRSWPSIAVGDVVTFTNLPGYAYAWNTAFNGIPKADVRFV